MYIYEIKVLTNVIQIPNEEKKKQLINFQDEEVI